MVDGGKDGARLVWLYGRVWPRLQQPSVRKRHIPKTYPFLAAFVDSLQASISSAADHAKRIYALGSTYYMTTNLGINIGLSRDHL